MKPIANLEIRKNADLDAAFGATIAKLVRGFRQGDMQRLPRRVLAYREKPAFYLNDGCTLHAYAIDLTTGKLLGERYCGCADTAANNAAAQFSQGGTAPAGCALIFTETFWNGRNHSWTVHVVSPTIGAGWIGA